MTHSKTSREQYKKKMHEFPGKWSCSEDLEYYQCLSTCVRLMQRTVMVAVVKGA